MNDFYNCLKYWWMKYKRNFPWRETTDPYEILIAEILLHRTRAEQVLPVYVEFIEKYPSPIAIAEAKVEDIIKILYPLGLRWRSYLLYEMAKKIIKSGGSIKKDKKWLLSLPGVSDYIACAVMCFAFGEPEPILDTNTVRIVGRIHGIHITDGSRRSKKFRELYKQLMDYNNAREFNYAMIDFGAIVCKPREPLCLECPIKKWCLYFKNILKLENKQVIDNA